MTTAMEPPIDNFGRTDWASSRRGEILAEIQHEIARQIAAEPASFAKAIMADLREIAADEYLANAKRWVGARAALRRHSPALADRADVGTFTLMMEDDLS